MKHNLRRWLPLSNHSHNLFYGCSNIGGIRIIKRIVVRADHQNHALRSIAVKFTVIDAPDNGLRTVTAVAKVEC